MPTPSPVKGGKLPRARVERFFISRIDSHAYITRNDTVTEIPDHHCALLPCATQSQAARICKAHNMTQKERVLMVAKTICEKDYYWNLIQPDRRDDFKAQAVLVLNALGLGGEATR